MLGIKLNLEQLTIKRYLYFLIIMAIIMIVYFPAVTKGFALNLNDDDWMVYNNPYITSLRPGDILKMFTTIYNGQYSPINTLYYALIFKLSGYSPVGYHIMSLCIHILNTYIVFKITETLYTKKDDTSSKTSIFALITSIFFALHPLQVESVVWISASKILLYSFFFLSSLYFYLIFRKNNKRIYIFLTYIFFILSFLCKEQAVVLPVCLLLIDWYRDKLSFTRQYLKEILPLFLISLIMSIFSLYAQKHGFSTELKNNEMTILERIVIASYAIIQYISKIFLPVNLKYIYSFPFKLGGALSWKVFIYPVAILALVYLFFSKPKHQKESKFYIIFAIINIFLVLHIIPMARGSIISNRYMYLSLFGVSLFLNNYIQYIFKKKISTYLILFTLVNIVCSLLTYRYLMTWE